LKSTIHSQSKIIPIPLRYIPPHHIPSLIKLHHRVSKSSINHFHSNPNPNPKKSQQYRQIFTPRLLKISNFPILHNSEITPNPNSNSNSPTKHNLNLIKIISFIQFSILFFLQFNYRYG